MDYFALTIAVLGGLAIFVYGMGLMSEGLTQIAGARMKAVLGYVTKNRFAAILAGTAVTAVIQSSSATTVMTVGFVNAGLLSLQQAIGVIFGANIGTTVTGQLVSFKLDDLALPAILLGVVGLMIARRAMARGAWRTVLGFGFLFFGMTMMSHELKALAELPSFKNFFSLFDCAPNAAGFLPFGSVLGAVAVGTVCTMVVQSSSATIGITIALAEAGLIDVWTAVPIVLGDNIGTTITAALASIGTNANARRTALAHALFNILGTTILLSTFVFVFKRADGVAAPAFFHYVNLCTEGDGLAGSNPGRFVAMAHTLFNVTNVVVLTAFIPLLARLCTRLVPEKRQERALVLEPNFLATPELALDAARRALADMTRRAWTVSSVSLMSYFGKRAIDEESVRKAEEEIDEMQTRIRDYLIAVSQRKLTASEAQAIPEILHCVNDAERISDLALKIFRKTARVRREDLPAELLDAANAVMPLVRAFARETIAAVKTGGKFTENPRETEARIHAQAKEMTRLFAARINAEGRRAETDMALLSVVSGLRDISRHLRNIAVRAPLIA